MALDLALARRIDASDFSLYTDEKFSILKPDRAMFSKFLTDAPFLFAVIWVIVQEQVMEKHIRYVAWADSEACPPGASAPPPDSFPISPKENPAEAELEFVSGVNGATVELARSAFLEALADFFPDHRTVLSSLRNQMKNLSEKVASKLQETEPMFAEILEHEMNEGIKRIKEEFAKTQSGNLGAT